MIFVCRLLNRTFLSSCRNNVLGAYSLASSATVRSQARCFSLESQQIIPEDRVLRTQASLDMIKGEKIFATSKRKNHFHKFLDSCFLKQEFSPSYIISFIRVACNDRSCSPELVFSLLMGLSKCLKANNTELIISLDQKIEILSFVLRPKYSQILPLICSIFKMNEDPLSLKGFVEDLVLNQKLTEAAYCISALNLQQECDVEEVVLPLLADGKIIPVLSCLTNYPDIQLKVAQKLDSFLVVGKLQTTNVCSSFNPKIIFKTLSSFVNNFKIPPEQCKNLHFIRGKAAINILLKKKYQQVIQESTWEDMVMSVIAKNPLVKEHLIYKLVANKDMDTALKMISKLDMQDFDIASLTAGMKNDSHSALTSKIETEEISDEKCDIEDPGHLSFPLSASDIHFIDKKEKFYDCIQDIQNYKIIGVDSEWKPHFGLSHDRLSLIQLAMHDKVYILDMISLNECLKTEVWDRLIGDVFGSSGIVKLGCGIMSDVQMIVDANKGNNGKVMRFSHILDIAIFYRKLQEVYPGNLGEAPENPKNPLGLSKLCEMLLGKCLNKEERLCDWEKRPLTESQLEYAALDAHCLLQIYDALKEVCLEKDMRFEHMANVAMILTSSLSKPRRRLKQVKSEKVLQIYNPIPIHKFKVVVDSESELLGKQLRQLGADVVFLRDSDTHDTAIQISNSEDRLLICSEQLWNVVQNKVSRVICTNSIDNLENDEVSASHIIQRFNVQLKAKYMLSRCLVCNSNESILLSPENMNELQEWTSKKVSSIKSETEISSFHRTLNEMSESGIDIKFNQQTSPPSSPHILSYLCTKCGTVQ